MYKIFPYKKENINKKDKNGNYLNKIYSIQNEGKAVVIERFNRILKNKMFKKFTEQGNQKWLKLLPIVVNEYNNTIHSSIGISPKEASKNPNLIKDIQTQKNYENDNNKIKKPSFKINQRVRIFKYKSLFEKGYKAKWTREIFIISKVNNTNPITYELKDLDGEDIIGKFYDNELQKTDF